MIQAFSRPMSYGQYLKSLLPSVLTMIFLSFYTTIDGFFVSRYAGSDALAGINIVIPITCVTFGVAVMLATGAGAIIGEHLGRGEMEQANRIFSFMCLVLLAFSVAFTALGVAFLRPIAVLLGSSERLMPHVLPYALVVFLGTVPMAFKLFFEYLVRSDGNSKVGLAMSVVGLVLNVGLDYLFVGVYGLGTLGAAWGTTLSITASALIGLVYFLRFGNIRFARPKADAKVLLKSCTNGSSEMFTEFSTGITTLLFNLMVMKYFGEDGVAAVTIIMYIYYFFISFYMGIAVAVAPVVSYNVGAQNPAKIREMLRYSFRTIAVTAALILAASLLGGQAIIHLFVQSGNVFDITWQALRLFSPVFVFIGFNVFLSGYFTALGNGLTSAVISLLRSLVLVVLFIAVLPLLLEENGIWLTMPFSEAATVLVAVQLYRMQGRPPAATA
ncbi:MULTISPECIES: MATE family efflux transporter [Allofournierella]|uniref:MATE family efflux transporter n=1 Tax=Allofournierella TaxID=1940255 RepID=UPI002E764F6C|nr:MATE family efflux transporter [Fournierella sp.]MEE0757436.1 MATE family efflux transporter [Fournierella sp.]